jgi:hypothetical protein
MEMETLNEQFEYAKKNMYNIDNVPIITDYLINKLMPFHILNKKGHQLSTFYLGFYYLQFAYLFINKKNGNKEASEMLKLAMKYLFESYTNGHQDSKSIITKLIIMINISKTNDGNIVYYIDETKYEEFEQLIKIEFIDIIKS